MSRLKALFRQHRNFVVYVSVGALTTIVNSLVYYCLYGLLNVSNVLSTLLAWIIAVLFAFVMNKTWVFRSKSWEAGVVIREAGSFFGCRALTGIFDIGFMWLTVDQLLWNGIMMKIISNVFVTIINYYASKLFIFRNRKAQ